MSKVDQFIIDLIKSQFVEPNNTTIDFSNVEIGDETAEIFAELLENNTSAKEINLSNNIITDKGAMLLANALYKNDTLEVLWLSYNKITIAGAEVFAKLLSYRSKPFMLFFNGNKIGIGAYALNEAMSKNPKCKIQLN